MQVAELVAGRELDALVAERVMLWHRVDEEHSWWVDSNDEIQHYVDAFNPSSPHGIAAAWQVVELMQPRHGPLTLIGAYTTNDWTAYFGHQMANGADTAPMAICCAALDVADL